MTGFGFAGGEGTRRHSWASRTSWTKGEYSLWVMHSEICSSAEFSAFTWKCQGKSPSQGTTGNTWNIVQVPLSLQLSVRRKSLPSSGESWRSFIPARRFLFCYFHFPDTTVLQLLGWVGFGLLDWNQQELEDAGSGKGFFPTSLPVSAARAGWRWV